MLLVQRAGGDEIYAVVRQAMNRSVRPVFGRQLGIRIYETHQWQLEGVPGAQVLVCLGETHPGSCVEDAMSRFLADNKLARPRKRC